jgi:Leucyl aminopeptidase
MNTTIIITEKTNANAKVYLLNNLDEMEKTDFNTEEKEYFRRKYEKSKTKAVCINRYSSMVFVAVLDSEGKDYIRLETCRKNGAAIAKQLNNNNFEEILLISFAEQPKALLALAEGIALANYQFLKYKTKKDENSLKRILLLKDSVCSECLAKLNAIVEATSWARDLINEPVNYLNARKLAEEAASKVQQAGGTSEVFGKEKIISLKMGGLLAVNSGSLDEPTFSILEWKPDQPKNNKPIVLVGKGVVYDTGGYNLKTGTFMSTMKHDMSGAATVAATLLAATKSKLPIHLIALIPATDNRIDGNAHVPDDIITMFDGTTVEMKNTDAEGRLILADALAYAKKYEPLMVFDFATLTGAAHRAIGSYGSVVMGAKADDIYNEIETSGYETYERVTRFPMWPEYGDLVKSDIADLKNIGGTEAGAITAAKFLEHFTDYPWLHFDIAGTAFSDSDKDYYSKGGTGVGIRLLMHYLSHWTA